MNLVPLGEGVFVSKTCLDMLEKTTFMRNFFSGLTTLFPNHQVAGFTNGDKVRPTISKEQFMARLHVDGYPHYLTSVYADAVFNESLTVINTETFQGTDVVYVTVLTDSGNIFMFPSTDLEVIN